MGRRPTYEELEETIRVLENADSERRRTEEMVKDEISWRRRLVEQSRDGIVVLDQNGKVYETNKRFADMLGYSIEETCRLHVWDWDFQFDKEQLKEMIGSIDEKGDHFETKQRRKDGTLIDVELSTNGAEYRGQKLVFCICRDITDRKKIDKERETLINELMAASAEIKTLKGILPICSYCNKIMDSEGYWERIDVYIKKYSEAKLSHGLCPDCAKKIYSEYFPPNA
jgi:PAS domain S-box-containing protein